MYRSCLLSISMALSPILLWGTDLVVDPSLSVGNGTTLFADITSAVNASVDGDRILITPGVYQEAAFTISNSLTLMPTDDVSDVTINCNITVNTANHRVINFVHINLGQYHLTVNGNSSSFDLTLLESQVSDLTINGSSSQGYGITLLNTDLSNLTVNVPGNMNNRCELHIIDCSISSTLSVDQDGWDLGLIRSSAGSTVTYRFGDVVMSTMPRLILNDEAGGNSLENRHAIIQNNISVYLEIRNDNCPVRIANNSLKNLYLFMWNHTADKIDIINNEFASSTHIHMPWNPPAWNIRFNNNIFASDPTFIRWATEYNYWNNTNFNWCDTNDDWDCGTITVAGNQNWNGVLPFIGTRDMYDCDGQNCHHDHATDIGSNINFWSTGEAAFPNPSIEGFFEWSYNSHELPQPNVSSGNPIVYTEVGNGGASVDGGSPEHDYYDLDLTVNDRGRDGGPWGTANFPANASGKAFIFDLDIPADLYPGSQVDIKAKAYQRY